MAEVEEVSVDAVGQLDKNTVAFIDEGRHAIVSSEIYITLRFLVMDTPGEMSLRNRMKIGSNS